MSTPDPAALAAQIKQSPPPVENWNPPVSGTMAMRIARDGIWWHEGTPITRTALVKLFASILRRDEDGCYYLLTPVEKWRIQVDDAPFLAVAMVISQPGCAQTLSFTTNVGDTITAGPDHPLRVEFAPVSGEPAPYLHVRGRLWALLTRAVYLELAEQAVEHPVGTTSCYGVWSQGVFFPLDRPVE